VLQHVKIVEEYATKGLVFIQLNTVCARLEQVKNMASVQFQSVTNNLCQD